MDNKLAIAILGHGAEPEVTIDIDKEAMLECANGIMRAINQGDITLLKEHLLTFLDLWATKSEDDSVAGDEYDRNIEKSKKAWSFEGEK